MLPSILIPLCIMMNKTIFGKQKVSAHDIRLGRRFSFPHDNQSVYKVLNKESEYLSKCDISVCIF